MSSNSYPRRGITLTLAGLLALASMLVVLAVSGTHEGHAATEHDHGTAVSVHTPKQLAFHDAMRRLWQDHGTWTHHAINSFVDGAPDLNAAVTRLLANQTDIGNAVKPYYGRAGGAKLTTLLKAHINDAVGVLKAVKSGDKSQIAAAEGAFSRNGNQIAAFLHTANPRFWSVGAMRTMMRLHLNQVLALATDRFGGNYAAEVREYDVYIDHIQSMADMLSSGIMKQFPSRFR
jgi:hypothetical protein